MIKKEQKMSKEQKMVRQMASMYVEDREADGLSAANVDEGDFYDYVKANWGAAVAQGPLFKQALALLK